MDVDLQASSPVPVDGSALIGVVRRICVSSGIPAIAAIFAHQWFTNALIRHFTLLRWAMAISEVSVFAVAGGVYGVLSALQFVLIQRRSIDFAISSVWTKVVPSDFDEAAGEQVHTTVRKIVRQLEQTPGISGVLIRSFVDYTGVFSDPAIERIVQKVQQEEEEEASAGEKQPGSPPRTRLSGFVSHVVEQCAASHIQGLKSIVVFAAMVVVAAADAALVAADRGLHALCVPAAEAAGAAAGM